MKSPRLMCCAAQFAIEPVQQLATACDKRLANLTG
jgi:hypothetical protein